MFPLEAFQSTLAKVATIFNGLKIAFHLTGGVTSIAYGEPRMTQDVDLVIDNAAARQDIEALLKAVAEQGFLYDASAVRDAIAEERLFQLLDLSLIHI